MYPQSILPALHVDDCPASVVSSLSHPASSHRNDESSTGHVNADACILLIQLSFHLFQLVQRFWIAFPEVLATWRTLWLRAHLGTVSDYRSKMLRIFQPLESRPLTYTMCLFRYWPCSAALGPTLSSTLTTTNYFSTSSRRSNFSRSPCAMMSSPWMAVIESVSKQ